MFVINQKEGSKVLYPYCLLFCRNFRLVLFMCLSKSPFELSGGQKQRVGLGGVMVGQVDVLLFDEPLANLDPATGKQAIVLIDEIQQRTGCAVIIIEHRVEDVLYRPVDRVVLMGDGNIKGVEVCAPADVKAVAVRISKPSGEVDCLSKRHLRQAAIWKTLLPVRRWILAVYRRLFI